MFPSSNQRSGSRLTVLAATLAAMVEISLGWGEGCSAMFTRHRFTTPLGVIKSLRVRIEGKRGMMSPCRHWRYSFCEKEDDDVRGLGPSYDVMLLLFSWV